MTGPFYVKENGEYKLARICDECAFGDENGCVLSNCVVLVEPVDYENDEEE